MEEKKLLFPDGYYIYDKSNMKKVLDEFPLQVAEGMALGKDIRVDKTSHIYWLGIGGSGISGMIIKALLRDKVHFNIVNSYDLPQNIPQGSLIIACSYSGNTEETLSTYKSAVRTHKNIFSISSGGRLEEMAKLNRRQHMLIPKGIQPRNSIPYQVFPVLRILSEAGIIESVEQDVRHMLEAINMQALASMAAELSIKLRDKIPIVYASDKYYAMAYRWRCEFNENAKVLALTHELPEMCHNEILGYTLLKGRYYCIMLRFDDDHRRVQKRMDLLKNIMKRGGVEVTEIALKGRLLSKVFTAILIGDYTSFYLGIGYKIDPSQVRIIEKLKKDLGPFV